MAVSNKVVIELLVYSKLHSKSRDYLYIYILLFVCFKGMQPTQSGILSFCTTFTSREKVCLIGVIILIAIYNIMWLQSDS